jgi:type I restriction enzyme, S subunit
VSGTLTTLGDCCRIVSGSTPDTGVSAYWGGDIYWATPKDLSELLSAYIENTPRKLTKAGLDSCSAVALPVGSVLFSSRAPIGHVAINTVPMCTNQGFKSFVPNAKKVFNKYLYYWLKANKEQLQNLGNGATFKEVSKATLSAVQIFLPSLDEQRRLAAILDKADALLEKRRQAINKLDTLLQSIFLDMFGDPLRNPKRFEEGILEQSIQLKGGFAFRSADYTATGIPLVKIGEVNRAEFKPESLSFLPTHFLSTHSRFVLHAGDLVMSLTGTTGKEDYANVVMLGNDYDKYFLNQRVALVQPNESIFTREYLFCLLKNPGIKRQITSKSRGIRQANISNNDILHLRVAIPPLELQKRFSNLFMSIRGLGVKQSRAASRSNDLFQGLKQAAFKKVSS